jgi:hypothetical protein
MERKDSGDFIGFVGNFTGRSLLCRTVAVFRDTPRFPSKGVPAPEFFAGNVLPGYFPAWRDGSMSPEILFQGERL